MNETEYTLMSNLQRLSDAEKILRDIETGDDLELGISRGDYVSLVKTIRSAIKRINSRIEVEPDPLFNAMENDTDID